MDSETRSISGATQEVDSFHRPVCHLSKSLLFSVFFSRSQQTPLSWAAASVVSPHSSPHARRREESRETSESHPRMLSSRGSRSSDRGAWKNRRARSRMSSSRWRCRHSRSLSPLPVRCQEVESDDNCHRPGRSLLVPAHAVTGRGLLTATGRGVEALVHGETGLDTRIDNGLGVTGRGQLTTTGHVVSVCVPLPAREIGVTARGHTLSRVAFVIARGHAGNNLPFLPARGRRRQDGWPDESSRRVLRRLSLSLLLFLRCWWQLLLLQEGLLYRHFRLLCRILLGFF